jgi:hypothetical protein
LSGIDSLFTGRTDANEHISMLLSLKSPKNTKDYLIKTQRRINCYVSSYDNIMERWRACPCAKINNIRPIVNRDLLRSHITSKIADNMAFDVSRFIDFLEGSAKVAADVKPVMLHYSAIYLLDFFSRTWLKCESSTRHGLKMINEGTEKPEGVKVQILPKGFFSRIVDSFYIMNQESLFSSDDESGFRKYYNLSDGKWYPDLEKKKYLNRPKIGLGELLSVYELLKKEKVKSLIANQILTGYLILFLVSSISRYKAKYWSEIRNNRRLSNRIELVNCDFTSRWFPELLLQKDIFKLLNEV